MSDATARLVIGLTLVAPPATLPAQEMRAAWLPVAPWTGAAPVRDGAVSIAVSSTGSTLFVESALSLVGGLAVLGIGSAAADSSSDEAGVAAFGIGAIGGAMLGSLAMHRRPSVLGAIVGGAIPTVVGAVIASGLEGEPTWGVTLVVGFTLCSIPGAVGGSHLGW